MSRLEHIEAQIAALSREEFWEFDRRFSEMKEDRWDQEIEEDVLAGRVDHLAEKALREYAEGRTLPLIVPGEDEVQP